MFARLLSSISRALSNMESPFGRPSRKRSSRTDGWAGSRESPWYGLREKSRHPRFPWISSFARSSSSARPRTTSRASSVGRRRQGPDGCRRRRDLCGTPSGGSPGGRGPCQGRQEDGAEGPDHPKATDGPPRSDSDSSSASIRTDPGDPLNSGAVPVRVRRPDERQHLDGPRLGAGKANTARTLASPFGDCREPS